MIWSRLPLLMATPHLDPLPFTKGRGGRSPVDPKLTINEHYHGKSFGTPGSRE